MTYSIIEKKEVAIVPISKHRDFDFGKLLALMDKIKLPTQKGFDLYEVSHITYLEAQSNYTMVHFVDSKKLLITKTLKYMESYLPERLFVRIHKSYLVNGMHIKSVVASKEHTLTLEQNIVLPIARSRIHLFI